MIDIVPIRQIVRKILDDKIGADIDPDVLESLIEDLSIRWYDDTTHWFNEGINSGFQTGFSL